MTEAISDPVTEKLNAAKTIADLIAVVNADKGCPRVRFQRLAACAG